MTTYYIVIAAGKLGKKHDALSTSTAGCYLFSFFYQAALICKYFKTECATYDVCMHCRDNIRIGKK